MAKFRDWLNDPDPQVRLNAAVRLAYLNCADGLTELVAGLEHPEGAIRFVQVPEALALLGDRGLAQARELVRRPGPARLAAARTLTHHGELGGVVETIMDTLGDTDTLCRGEAMSLAGELGPAAAGAFDALAATVAGGDPVDTVFPALASIGGTRAMPLLMQAINDGPTLVRIRALHGVAGLGLDAADAHDQVAAVLDDTSLSQRERLAAGHALTRIGPSGDAVAARVTAALQGSDRWLRIGLLRTLAQLAPGYPRRPEVSQVWPLWESRFVHAAPAQRISRSREGVLSILVEHLDHDDYDVRRNAALAMALFGRAGRSAITQVANASRLPEPLRYEVLRRLGPRTSAGSDRSGRRGPYDHLDQARWPWDLHLTQPTVDLDRIAEDCERQWAQASGGDLDYRIDVPKWQFLHYLVERHQVVLHGSPTPGIDVLTPRSRSWGGGRTSGQPGVFAVDHALFAMYFAIMDNGKVSYKSNGIWTSKRPDGSAVRSFRLAIEFAGLAARPFHDGTIYILPAETFTMMGELTSLVPVRPYARLAISPSDHPVLEHIWGSDVGPLSTQFGDRFPFLRDAGIWPAKRSARSV